MDQLAPHVGAVVAILAIVFSLLMGTVGFILMRIWLNIDKLQTRIEEYLRLHYDCQRSLPLNFLGKDEFQKWRMEWIAEWKSFLARRDRDWETYWEAFNHHGHDKNSGKVIR